jgi:hypothetical protein
VVLVEDVEVEVQEEKEVETEEGMAEGEEELVEQVG